VKSPYGYHVIEVESRTPAQKATLASAHAKIADELRQQQEGPLVQPFLQSLMQSAKIQTSDPQFAGLFATAGQPGAAPQQ
jgi:parvulin-like peptidyl-prolyl isomerase